MYLIMHGSRDGDVSDFQGYQTYDRAHVVDLANPAASAENNKALLWIHRANHNHFNSVWADEWGGGTFYTYDGAARSHGHLPRIPGSAALAVSMRTDGLTVIHEFGHAGSDFNNGKVIDLYNDGGNGTGFLVNKKFRASASNPVPPNFGNYNGAAFTADAVRDGLTYPNTWRSYHPVPTDATRPNLMDNYWLAHDDPHLCRFDQVTYR